MKKAIPFISPIVFGILSGLLIECTLGALSIVFSLFSDFNMAPFAAVLCITSILVALLITIMAIINVNYLINTKDKRQTSLLITMEVFCGILLFFAFLPFWESIIHGLFNLFQDFISKIPDPNYKA